jgi:hypothetical protein
MVGLRGVVYNPVLVLIPARAALRAATMPTARIREFAGRFARHDRIRFACGTVLVMHLVLLAVMFATTRGGRTILGPGLGADFAGFYTAGTILNTYPADRLYDLELQDRLYHRLLPAIPPGESLPFPQSPFVAVLFRLLARLPYAWAYAVWLVISGGVALAGLVLTVRTAGAIPSEDRTTAVLLALTFQPLLTECWLGGQTSAFGLFWVAVALRCERLDRPIAAGAALAMCLFKLTLLVWVVPMLVVSGRLRALAGFALAALGLAAFSLLTVGPAGCLSYADLLLGYARNVTGHAPVFRTFKFVDIRSFFTLLLGGPSLVAQAASLTTALIGLPFLVSCWWSARRPGVDRRILALGATLSWTAVFNLYTPVYDVALVLPGVILTADVLYRRAGSRSLDPRFRAILALLVLVPWVSQALALSIGFQPLTLVLLALGIDQIGLVRRIGRDGMEATRVESGSTPVPSPPGRGLG